MISPDKPYCSYIQGQYNHAKAWLELIQQYASFDPEVSKAALPKARHLAEERYKYFRRQVLNDPACLEEYKKIQRLKKTRLCRAWKLISGSQIENSDKSKISKDSRWIHKHFKWVDEYFSLLADRVPGYTDAETELALIEWLCLTSRSDDLGPYTFGAALRDAFGQLAYWEQQMADKDNF